jgi:hypothetical protein
MDNNARISGKRVKRILAKDHIQNVIVFPLKH